MKTELRILEEVDEDEMGKPKFIAEITDDSGSDTVKVVLDMFDGNIPRLIDIYDDNDVSIEKKCSHCGLLYQLKYKDYTGEPCRFCPYCGSRTKESCDGCHNDIDLDEDPYMKQDDIAVKYYWCKYCIPEVLKAHGLELKNERYD